MGLALVVELVDHLTTVTNPATGEAITSPYGDLNSMAMQEGAAITSYMYNGYFPLTPNYWMSDPKGFPTPEADGGCVWAWEIPLSKLAWNIFNTSIPVDYKSINPAEVGLLRAWELIATCLVYNNNSNDISAVASAAVGNAGNNINSSTEIINWLGGDGHCSSGPYYGRNLFYRAVSDVLYSSENYNDISAFPLCDMESIIDAAPKNGPYAHSDTDYAPGGWGSDRRFIDAAGNGTGTWGNFNGLDYMLLYNLYYILLGMQAPPVIIPGTYYYTYPCTDGSGIVGFNTNPFVVSTCSTINVNTLNIANNGGLQLLAGEQAYIDIKPTLGNIIVQPGGYLYAACSNDCCQPPLMDYFYQDDPGSCADNQSAKADSNLFVIYQKTDEFDTAFVNNSIINYPNPFISNTNIEFTLKQYGPVSIYILDAIGRKVYTLINNENFNAGGHVIQYNGSLLPSGIYYGILKTNAQVKQCKMTKVKY
jgi:hypothetical protein